MEAPETELKFELTGAALLKLGEHPLFSAPAETSQLQSTYFDTPGAGLKDAGFGLRVRKTGKRYLQTLKRQRSGSPIRRGEWEAEVAGDSPEPALLADTPVADLLSGEALAPVFATIVNRTRRLWVDGPNVIEVSLDQGEITAGQRSEPVQELELELKEGDPAALFELARALSDCASLRLSFDSKAERGYRLAAGEARASRKSEPGGVAPGDSTEQAFRKIGWACMSQVSANAEILRKRRSMEALHQTRIGLRRFRAALTAFQAVVAGAGYDEIKAETRWLARQLDEARDIDIFIQDAFQTAQVADEDRAACARFGARLLAAQTGAYEKVLATLDSPRYAQLLLKAAAWLEIGAWARDEDPQRRDLRQRKAVRFAGARLDHLLGQVLKRGRRLASLDDEGRHQLRIKAKKLRYVAEFFAGCFGEHHPGKRKRFVRALQILQDKLGLLNDIAVADRLAASLVKQQPAELAFAAGLIVGGRQGEARAIHRAAQDAFDALKGLKPFWH